MKMMTKTAAFLGAALFCLSGCSARFITAGTGVKYKNAEKYTAGDCEITGKIDALDIDWPSGSVEVKVSDGDTVTVKETTKADLEDDLKVHSWADGSVLRVRFCKSGTNYRKSESKTLEITVPEGTLFETVTADTASAELTCTGLKAKTVDLDAASGTLRYTGTADTFRADAASGNVVFSGEARVIKTDTASGNVTVDLTGRNESISADTASGKMNISAEQPGKISADSASGDQSFRLNAVPQEMNLDSASGDVCIYLPEDAGFTADISTASGTVQSEMPLTKSGNGTYTCGSGGSKIEVDTASGDVSIMKLRGEAE
ncbi:MAG: DUF4097 family beta strand repeat protein [Oscillospiraceae bacterium]|nr:DUF4097 family beta strand repeat protein [Oscillospiraceae bacterium]